MQHAPSLRALKLMHLMIGTAGGRMADPVLHNMRLSDVRATEGMAHHDQASLKPLFVELRAATMIQDKPDQPKWTIGGLLDDATVDYRDEAARDVLISWTFGSMFRRMAEESNHWAILDRQAVFHLGSKYSVLLFQHIASLQNLKHVTSKRFAVAEIRAVFGIPDDKITRFATLKQRIITPAIAEINSDLTRLHLTAIYHKIGRTVAEVEIAWTLKEDLTKIKDELDRPKVGRRARRDGTAEVPVSEFPADGPIQYAEPWATIARTHGNGKDINLIASDFRAWCSSKKIALAGPDTAPNIPKTFKSFCKSAKI